MAERALSTISAESALNDDRMAAVPLPGSEWDENQANVAVDDDQPPRSPVDPRTRIKRFGLVPPGTVEPLTEEERITRFRCRVGEDDRQHDPLRTFATRFDSAIDEWDTRVRNVERQQRSLQRQACGTRVTMQHFAYVLLIVGGWAFAATVIAAIALIH